MGIKGLNHFLKTTCFNNIYHISLNTLRGKTIVIDASIYLYRFKCDNMLIEGIYQMISQFEYYNITSIFVFDGKPPVEKNDVIQERRLVKREAEQKYYDTKDLIEKKELQDTCTLKREMEVLRKKIVKVSKSDTQKVKQLLSLMGVSYYECDGESDSICAFMVQTNQAYACLSEDMDLFVYGTRRVLRYLSLLKSTVVIYDIEGMLLTLGLTFKEFQDICVLSGSDYNKKDAIDFNCSLNMFTKYRESGVITSYGDWMIEKKHMDSDGFKRAIELFDISNITIERHRFIKSDGNNNKLKEFLETYGFIFGVSNIKDTSLNYIKF